MLPAAAITRGLEGESLTDIGELAEAGVRLFTDDGRLRAVLARSCAWRSSTRRAFDVVISQHAQDADLTEGWQMHEGHYSALLGLIGVPAEAEEIVVAPGPGPGPAHRRAAARHARLLGRGSVALIARREGRGASGSPRT